MDEATVESEIQALKDRVAVLEGTVAAITENLGNAGHPVVSLQAAAADPQPEDPVSNENI